MEPIIEFQNFSFKYRSQKEPTLKDINLAIYPGEKVLIVGPSGSGKSTLAHCINGLVPFSYAGDITGTYRIKGEDPAKRGIFGLSKSVGTVLQDTDGQFIGLTVAEDIAFALENDRVEYHEMRGRVDKAADAVDVKDLLPDEEIEKVKEQMYSQGANVKKIYSSEAYHNLDIYQVNTTYYSALGNNDKAYLLARAIQFFAPGIPQVYYVGMLAGSNDIALMEQTKNGRDINRHYYAKEEVAKEQERPVVQELKKLMTLRNTHLAFSLDGTIQVNSANDLLTITRTFGNDSITLHANLRTYDYTIE